jgi:hypothetical protein
MQYAKHHHVVCGSYNFTIFLFCNKIVKLRVVDGS